MSSELRMPIKRERFQMQGEEEVSREQFAELWKEFFSTEDPNAPGNFIFGNLKF